MHPFHTGLRGVFDPSDRALVPLSQWKRVAREDDSGFLRIEALLKEPVDGHRCRLLLHGDGFGVLACEQGAYDDASHVRAVTGTGFQFLAGTAYEVRARIGSDDMLVSTEGRSGRVSFDPVEQDRHISMPSAFTELMDASIMRARCLYARLAADMILVDPHPQRLRAMWDGFAKPMLRPVFLSESTDAPLARLLGVDKERDRAERMVPMVDTLTPTIPPAPSLRTVARAVGDVLFR